MKAISIRQPWAWAIIYGGKDIENRKWKTNFRGRVFVHAGKKSDLSAPRCVWEKFPYIGGLGSNFGGIIGSVEIVDCVTESDSPWFTGPYGFVLRNPVPLPFIYRKGQLGFFTVNFLPKELFLEKRTVTDDLLLSRRIDIKLPKIVIPSTETSAPKG